MHIGLPGLLGADPGDAQVIYVPTSRTVPLAEKQPVACVWHWTAGDYGTDVGHEDSVGLAKWIATGTGASWHFLIDKDGTVVQSAPVTVGTNHVGKLGTILGRPRSVNRTTIGIELENAGNLTEVNGRFYGWPVWRHDPKDPNKVPQRSLGPDPRYEVARERAVVADGGAFDAFTAAQEASALALVRALVGRFSWTREAFTYGHVHFDSPRKIDPGPVWLRTVLPRVLDQVFPITRVA